MSAKVASKVSSKEETKTALLEAGMNIMLLKGYSNTGIQEVLSSLGVPKGSFYHYFDSKENFAVAIIHHFDDGYTAFLLDTLRNAEFTPLQRLQNYCEAGRQKFLSQECRKGCLIGNLSQEMSDQSEILRKELSTVMGKWRDLFAACIDEGQKSGEIKTCWSADAMSELFLSGFAGAMLRAKTTKNTQPLDTFTSLMFNDILKT